jgi:hypothetical protein
MIMTTQHTPGPWITGDAAIWALDDCEFHAIVDCPLNQTCRDTETVWANARLIAAAPALLAALQSIAEIGPSLDFVGVREFALAAIAQATGETA